MLRDVSIFQIHDYAFTSSADTINGILETYFQHGELDRRYSWNLVVAGGGQTIYDNIQNAGDETPLAEYLEGLKQCRS